MWAITFAFLLVPEPETTVPVSYVVMRQRFPTQEYAKSACEFNRQFRTQAEQRLTEATLQLNPHVREHWQETIKETDELYRSWICLCTFPGEAEGEAFWDKWLNQLRYRIGEEAFAAGQMPPFVPEWRFQRIE